MSNAVLRWAWSQSLKPSSKLVLLALAEHADKKGECWPSRSRLEELTGLDVSTIKRSLREISDCGLIKRTAGNGRTTSLYSLRMEGVHHEPAGGAQRTRRGRIVNPERAHSEPGEGAQRTLRGRNLHLHSLYEPPMNPQLTTTTTVTEFTEPPEKSGGGGDWIFPRELTEEQRAVATTILERVNGQAQLLLDELAGQMRDGAIRVSPMACLRGMVKKALAGEFTSERGEKIARDRAKRAASEQRLREAAERPPEVAAPVDPEARARAAAFLSGLRKNMGRP